VLTTAIVLETRKGNFPLALALGGALLAAALVINLVILRFRSQRTP
jgi:tungstate transport system permease protein